MDISFGLFHFGYFVWETLFGILFGIFRLGSFVWDLCLGSFVWEAWDLRLGEPLLRLREPAAHDGGTSGGTQHYTANKKLSKNPSRQSLVRELYLRIEVMIAMSRTVGFDDGYQPRQRIV